jgi:hypothetical protein
MAMVHHVCPGGSGMRNLGCQEENAGKKPGETLCCHENLLEKMGPKEFSDEMDLSLFYP